MICTDYLSSKIYPWIDHVWSKLRIMNSWNFIFRWGKRGIHKRVRRDLNLSSYKRDQTIFLRIHMEEVLLWARNNPNQHRKMVDRDIFFRLTLCTEGWRWGERKGGDWNVLNFSRQLHTWLSSPLLSSSSISNILLDKLMMFFKLYWHQ